MVSDRQLFSGRFSDGASASSIVVDGEMRANELIFWPADAELTSSELPETHWVWRYDELTTNASVRAGDPDVLIHYPDAPGASLFVEESAFVRSLAARATHTSPTAWLWRFTKPALAILAVFLGIAGVMHVFDLSPSRALARLMPQDVRENIGNSLFTSLTKDKYKVCSSADGDAALNAMVNRLRREGDAPFTTRVIDWELENAFALPGGQIILTRGLIQGAANAEEVTGVLAHEIGHVVKLHPETAIVRALGLTVAAQFIFTGGAETAGNVGLLLVVLRFSRKAEREADTVGLRILKDAKVDPRPLAGFFNRMLKKQGLGPKAKSKSKDEKPKSSDEKSGGDKTGAKPEEDSLPRGLSSSLELLSTHPPSRNRVRKINAAATYAGRPVLSDKQWEALKSICKTEDKSKTK